MSSSRDLSSRSLTPTRETEVRSVESGIDDVEEGAGGVFSDRANDAGDTLSTGATTASGASERAGGRPAVADDDSSAGTGAFKTSHAEGDDDDEGIWLSRTDRVTVDGKDEPEIPEEWTRSPPGVTIPSTGDVSSTDSKLSKDDSSRHTRTSHAPSVSVDYTHADSVRNRGSTDRSTFRSLLSSILSSLNPVPRRYRLDRKGEIATRASLGQRTDDPILKNTHPEGPNVSTSASTLSHSNQLIGLSSSTNNKEQGISSVKTKSISGWWRSSRWGTRRRSGYSRSKFKPKANVSTAGDMSNESTHEDPAPIPFQEAEADRDQPSDEEVKRLVKGIDRLMDQDSRLSTVTDEETTESEKSSPGTRKTAAATKADSLAEPGMKYEGGKPENPSSETTISVDSKRAMSSIIDKLRTRRLS
ncbi:hypothetical protein I317_07749 [Kwoniella heveanensis CBS 569]|uniref:Uncharacterized protein n=1 Tax=Kwoniella heveanensis BCC8398 TaxID=1296120 RepID=A0A1B9GTU8_9TREE|nr:hypothetical protein I316_03912 [Kwoniella heveanensis BCC8398]OCF38473.1 hypothetical protein I317_07749 [Kwoniella heveanensis CBS 569]